MVSHAAALLFSSVHMRGQILLGKPAFVILVIGMVAIPENLVASFQACPLSIRSTISSSDAFLKAQNSRAILFIIIPSAIIKMFEDVLGQSDRKFSHLLNYNFVRIYYMVYTVLNYRNIRVRKTQALTILEI